MNEEQIFAENKIKWRRRNSYYYRSLENLFKNVIPENASVLEIGSSTGDTLSVLNCSNCAGIERNKYLIEHSSNIHPSINFVKADIEEIDEMRSLVSSTFDYIIISDLIGTLSDIQSMFEKLRDVCSENTKLIVTYHNYLWNPILKIAEKMNLKMKEGVKNWLFIDEIQNLLYLSGFETDRRGFLILLPLYIPLISAFFNRFLIKLPLIRRLSLAGYVIASKLPDIITEPNTVSIVIPCRNEAGNIQEIIERTPELGSKTELIFVEGNSTDNTYEEIQKQAALSNREIKIFKQGGRGKGDAVRKGFDEAAGDVLMILDADMTVPPEELTKFYNALIEGKGEFINGSRLVYQMEDKAMRPLNKAGNIFFSKVFSWLLEQRITDTLCGTKVLYKKDYKKIESNRKYFGEFDPFGDFDLLFGAAKINLRITEVPIRYAERKYGTTNINRFRDGWLLLKMCWVAMKKLKFSY